MNIGWRQIIARWTPVFEYLLAGNLRMIGSLVAVLLVGWYFLTDYFLQLVTDSRHEEFEYAFLLGPFLLFVGSAWRVRQGIDSEREAQPASIPLSTNRFEPKTLAVMCDHLVIHDAHARGFFHWVGRMLASADVSRPLLLDDLPKAWRSRWTHWVGLVVKTSIPAALAVFLASPWQFYLGDLLARGLDWLPKEDDYVLCGKVCGPIRNRDCTSLVKQAWPGDLVSLTGDAPDMGRLRLSLRNWPRSGRYIRFKSQGMVITEPENSGIDLTVPVRGRVIELPYIVNDTNTWALWAEYKYFTFQGEKLETVTYSGMRVTPEIPTKSYR